MSREEGKAGEVPERAAWAATRWDLDSGISQSGRVVGTSLYSYITISDSLEHPLKVHAADLSFEDSWGTYAIDQVEDNSHSNAKFLKVQIAVIVDISEIPNPLELVIAELAVFENGSCLGACEVCAAVGERGEDLPVSFDLPLFYLLI